MIELRLRGKWRVKPIAAAIHRHHSIVSREIRRNRSPDGKYRAAYAQKEADLKTHLTNTRKIEENDDLFRYLVKRLKEGWSPEQIAGRLKRDRPAELAHVTISHESIYQYIYEGLYGKFLYQYLRRKRVPKRQPRFGRVKQAQLSIPERVSIHDRPVVINERQRVGDWESDSMLFRKQRAGLSVQYERVLMLMRLHRIPDRSAETTHTALVGSVESLPADLWKSVTFDNGGEGALHVKLRQDYGIGTYFCDPYKSWQKGGVENAIGLLRQYLPGKTDLGTLSENDLHAIQERLNNRPRKKLGFETPNERLLKIKTTL